LIRAPGACGRTADPIVSLRLIHYSEHSTPFNNRKKIQRLQPVARVEAPTYRFRAIPSGLFPDWWYVLLHTLRRMQVRVDRLEILTRPSLVLRPGLGEFMSRPCVWLPTSQESRVSTSFSERQFSWCTKWLKSS
jgi:hypothetical protein